MNILCEIICLAVNYHMHEQTSKVRFLSLISDIISLIIFLISVLSGSLYIAFKSIEALFFSIFFAILLIISFFFRKRIAKCIMIYLMNLTAPDKRCRITSKKVIYEYKSMTEMCFSNEFFVKPLYDGLTSFPDKYKWTGPYTPKPKPLISNHKIDLIDIKYGYQRYCINLGAKSYNKSDRPIRTGIKLESLKDPDRQASPHLATGIYDCTENLTLEVWFPMDVNVTNIRKLEYIHFTDEEHYHCTEENSPEICNELKKKVIRYSIKRPIYGGKYLIDWEFCD